MAEYPLPKFHFLVDWAGTNIGFTEVTGLTVETEAIEYRHGASPEFNKTKQAGMQKYSNITLKRGTFEKDNEFFTWWKQTKLFEAKEENYRRTITIKLLNESHEPIVTWEVKNAWPVKVQSADLKADANEIAIESIELVHEGIEIKNPVLSMPNPQSSDSYYPPVNFHFAVYFGQESSISGSDTSLAQEAIAFQSVSGLNVQIQTETIKEGGENTFEHVVPVRAKYTDLVLKRGLIYQKSSIMEWLTNAFQNS